MPLDPLYILCAVVAVVISGLAKGGFSGAGSLAMPILALAIDPVRAAAILLPILIVQDVVGVWAFRRTWDGHVLAVMIPGMTIGVALGYFFSAQVSADVVLGVLGAISILFGLQRLWVERGHAITLPSNSPAWLGVLFGVASGFTSHVAHAGSPPFQMWVLPRKLPRDTLVGTTAIAFAVMNWIKVPAYAALGQFTHANLLATAALIPLALISTMLGVKLVRKVDPERFYVLIYVLMILLGVKLLADALM
ncbi:MULTISPECIES: sulfite exporter TauE/SafE family protein [Sphingobium]|uniref:sulfite exporter TauE/SafE family protein n=1 Tax=Sphingobium TaxID=165695 RepID=UPI0015EB8595|nr:MULTISPECIES: sulfite exporter TauE/SafE family protein [Sphingobium]MCW2362211.1 putative membrane protein YfcA [Sphingobium sp. B10D3B]MCW2381399.1 putative membrane protein YfcA [Sphingobium sp. B2D3B]MCW2398494.1 putative membrane protein YfcA [Sphingobium sp. B2D3C]MCW2401110.1 putative membrane protein YfcA [Sphingobium sp. B10D7B]MCW2408090.1 putative membrane protein YfcA [Sphingobium xanthum]